MSEELQAVFQVVTGVRKYVKNSPFIGRQFAKLCDDMEAERTALLYSCELRWLSRAKVLHGAFELKQEITILKP